VIFPSKTAKVELSVFGTTPLLSHLGNRGRVRGFVACLSLASVVASTPPPEPTVGGVAALLGARVNGTVDIESIAWEPRRNVLAELVFGRRVMFLAASNGGPRDVYRAWVRLTPSGQPLAVRCVTNLTDTPDADELGLSLQAGAATFATVALGGVRAVTTLELDGAELERTDVLVDIRVREATLARDARSLTLRLDARDGEIHYDVARRVLESEPGVARVVLHTRVDKGFALRIADALRASVGESVPRVLASFGRAVRDSLERAVYDLVHIGRRPEARANAAKATVKDVRQARRPEDVWPPPKVPSLFSAAEPDEGVFRPLLTRGAEPCLYRTLTRSDPSRPAARTLLVAMDMRQLKLDWIAGADVPRPTAGPPGDGRLGTDPRALARVVAVFSGGRSRSDARHGASSGGRVLTPPVPSGVSIIEVSRGETLLGPWPFGRDVPSDVIAFRQGLVPLLDARGEPLVSSERDGDVKPRSALCATPAGHLYYAFGERLDEHALASTLSRAGCAYAVELGGGAEPAGMALVTAAGTAPKRFTPLDPAMSFDAASVFGGASRDFFVVSLKDTTPREPEAAVWKPDLGSQPEPASITGIFRASVPLGGLTVELFSFENGRVEWRLRPGSREPGARGEAWAGFLREGDAERALAAIELGHTTVTPRLGLALGTATPITLKDAFATLVVAPTEPPRILGPGEAKTLGTDEQAVQLPLLADADGVTERARERGDLRLRSALGVTRSGRTLVALLRHDSSDPLAVALKNAGAERVVELDRGSHHPAFVHRAGTATPPAPTYESTTLWALGRPMLPGARVVR
jgi:hypothetical protein